MFRIDRPLALALDAPRLRETCGQCLQWTSTDSTGLEDGGGGIFTPVGADIKKLRDCMGCKVVRYCGKVSLQNYMLQL